MKFFSVFLCQKCREIWREIWVKFSVLRFPGFRCAAENFTKISCQKRCEKRKISRKFHSAGAQRWDNPGPQKKEREYIRQNRPFMKPPFYLPVNKRVSQEKLASEAYRALGGVARHTIAKCYSGTLRQEVVLADVPPDLRVVFPLGEPWKPPGRKSPKNGKKLHNSPPRSNPRKWGKITEKLQKILRKYIFCIFSVIFPHFRGLDRGGEFCNFFPFFGDFPLGGFRGSLRGKTTRNPRSKTGTIKLRDPSRVHSDVPPERKPERGTFACSPRDEHPNEGTFAKTTLVRNHPFVSSRKNTYSRDPSWIVAFGFRSGFFGGFCLANLLGKQA